MSLNEESVLSSSCSKVAFKLNKLDKRVDTDQMCYIQCRY